MTPQELLKVLPKKSYVDVFNDETKQIDKIEEEWNKGYNQCLEDVETTLLLLSLIMEGQAGSIPASPKL